MIEMITNVVMPQRLEELIGLFLILTFWIYYFGLRKDSKISVNYSRTINETVSAIMIFSFIVTMFTYLSIKVIFWFIGDL